MMRFEIGKLALAAALALSIVAPAHADWQLLDNGVGTKQVVHDGSAVYALKDNGNIWMFARGQWQQLDNGSGTRMIAAAGGRVYAMKDDGRVFRFTYGQWSAIGSRGSRQVAAAGMDLYTLENNDDIFMFWHGDGQWRKIDNGTRTTMISGDDQRGLFVLKNTGSIFHHVGNGQFEVTDNGSGTKQIDSSGGVLYALKDNGNIWLWQGNGWTQVDTATGTRAIDASGGWLYVLKDNGNLYAARFENVPMKRDASLPASAAGVVGAAAAAPAAASDVRSVRFEQMR